MLVLMPARADVTLGCSAFRLPLGRPPPRQLPQFRGAGICATAGGATTAVACMEALQASARAIGTVHFDCDFFLIEQQGVTGLFVFFFTCRTGSHSFFFRSTTSTEYHVWKKCSNFRRTSVKETRCNEQPSKILPFLDMSCTKYYLSSRVQDFQVLLFTKQISSNSFSP